MGGEGRGEGGMMLGPPPLAHMAWACSTQEWVGAPPALSSHKKVHTGRE